jgi:hypothetical protein
MVAAVAAAAAALAAAVVEPADVPNQVRPPSIFKAALWQRIFR